MCEAVCSKIEKTITENEKKTSNVEEKLYMNEDYVSNSINVYLEDLRLDFLYHLGLDTTQDLVTLFGDVKFVCMGGAQKRMHDFAYYIMNVIGYTIPFGTELMDISKHAHRYSLYKIGPVLSVSHGMGTPSISILLHEMIKLMYYASCKNPIFFRIGTSGGVGLPGGSVVISESAVDGMCNHYYELPVLGKLVRRRCVFDKELIDELLSLADSDKSYDVVTGTTLCALDFYEGQSRLDGAFCGYSPKEKLLHMEYLYNYGIRNIEMESLVFGALTHQAGIRAAVVCVTLLDRLEGDQVSISPDQFKQWEERPQELVGRYIQKCFNNQNS